MEKWDAYDNKLNIIPNIELIRGEPIPNGIYHLVGEVIVKHIDDSYLIMQRSPNKHFGGKWELTAGGSALKGESPLDCAKRELEEETGVISSNITEIKRVIQEENHSIYVIYLCITDCKKDSIRLQENETINYQWLSKKEILAMSPNEMISHRTIQILKQPNINYLVQAFSILLNEDCILTRYYPLIPYKDKIISFSKDNNLINKDELIQYNTLPIFNNDSLDKLFKRFLIMYDNQDKLKILNKLISSNRLILDNNQYLAYLELFLLPGVKETRAEIYYLSGYKDLYSISISTVEEILNNINNTIINNKLEVSIPLVKEVKTHIAVAKAFCL